MTSIALGVRTAFGSGEAIPAALRDRVTAAVVIGNPVRRRQGSLLRTAPADADRAMGCSPGDTVCDPVGRNPLGHCGSLTNGSVDVATTFATRCVLSGCSAAPDAVPLGGAGARGRPPPDAAARAAPVAPTDAARCGGRPVVRVRSVHSSADRHTVHRAAGGAGAAPRRGPGSSRSSSRRRSRKPLEGNA